ncbi:hypothetical protein KI387_042715, partial [Taxus chinensis]
TKWASAWEVVRHECRSKIVPFLATNDIHCKHKLNKFREEAVVAYACILGCPDVEFSIEDAT